MSKNTPKEITTYNSNIKMSKNNSIIINPDYNIDYINMAKNKVEC